MTLARRVGVASPASAVRAWPVWGIGRWLVILVVSVTALDAIAIGAAARTAASVHPEQLAVFVALLACSALTVEMTRRAGENAGLTKDVFAAWELPIAILLPPFYAMVAPILRIILTQLRVVRIPVHRRVFTAAALGLSYGSASLVFRSVSRIALMHQPGDGIHTLVWILTVAACGLVQWAVNHGLVLLAIKGSDLTASVRTMLLAREQVHNDVTELCVAVLVTLGIATNPFSIAFAAPFVTLLQRSSRHAQLVNDTRLDSKTRLLNAATWEREAGAEVTRATRTSTPLAVALIDIDNFKSVNDTYGHLAGDRALRAISSTIKIFLREYDLVGRFGGEEFSLLLPQTGVQDARRVAERIRAHIAETPIEVADKAGSETISLTVSIGVAALSTTGSQLTELLATADAALYRAKHSGRNQVWVTTDTASFNSCVDSGG
ncbi:MAG TPA: GGDEF domain-containing protein [Streptosporangiaceae bacterium]|nr:GGDEF domain-containing protein [Streptosporangiaceae bacterium]